MYRPYDEVVKGLKTGDMLLFSSVKSSGSLIKILDRAVFGHCGLVSCMVIRDAKLSCKKNLFQLTNGFYTTPVFYMLHV